MTTTNRRYQAIKQQAEARKRQQAAAPVLRGLADVLDNLNAWAVLEDVRGRAPQGVGAYGPKTLRRLDSVGVVVWYKVGGFYGYKQLTLLGVWALAGNRVVVGTKSLAYSAATYNPESYHKLIRRDYRAHYTDDGAPPDAPLLTFTYDAAQRLAQRERVAQVVRRYTLG